MWRTLALVVTVACCSSEPSVTRPPAASAPPAKPVPMPVAEERVEDVAVRFSKAALAGDRATARSLTLTFEEVSKLSKKAVDQEAWETEVTELLDKLAIEGRDFGGTITGATVVETRTLDPATDDKVLQKIEVAVVQINVKESDGREHAAPFPWFFIKTTAGWKYSPKK